MSSSPDSDIVTFGSANVPTDKDIWDRLNAETDFRHERRLKNAKGRDTIIMISIQAKVSYHAYRLNRAFSGSWPKRGMPSKRQLVLFERGVNNEMVCTLPTCFDSYLHIAVSSVRSSLHSEKRRCTALIIRRTRFLPSSGQCGMLDPLSSLTPSIGGEIG